jgi:Peptidase M16 inactive domain
VEKQEGTGRPRRERPARGGLLFVCLFRMPRFAALSAEEHEAAERVFGGGSTLSGTDDSRSSLDAELEFTEAVSRGTVPGSGGLAYTIRPQCTRPARRIFLQLVVRCGRVCEDYYPSPSGDAAEGEAAKPAYSERGFARLVQQTAFRTGPAADFSETEAFAAMESGGRHFDVDLSSSLSLDGTRYWMVIPVADSDAHAVPAGSVDSGEHSVLGPETRTRRNVHQCLAVLAHMAGRIDFAAADAKQGPDQSPLQLAREATLAGMSLSAAAGVASRRDGALLDGTPYVDRFIERDTEEDRETVSSATPEQLTQFYKRWYRPDLTMISIAGDFSEQDGASLLEILQSAFAQPELTPAPARSLPSPPFYEFALTTNEPELEELSPEVRPRIHMDRDTTNDYTTLRIAFRYGSFFNDGEMMTMRDAYEDALQVFGMLVLQFVVQGQFEDDGIPVEIETDAERISRTAAVMDFQVTVPCGMEQYACETIAVVVDCLKSTDWLTHGEVGQAISSLKDALGVFMKDNFLEAENNNTEKRIDYLWKWWLYGELPVSDDIARQSIEKLVPLVSAASTARGMRSYLKWNAAIVYVALGRSAPPIDESQIIEAIDAGRRIAEEQVARAASGELQAEVHSLQFDAMVDRAGLMREFVQGNTPGPKNIQVDEETNTMEIQLTNGATVIVRSDEKLAGSLQIVATAQGGLLDAWANCGGTSPEFYSCGMAHSLVLSCFPWGGLNPTDLRSLFLTVHGSVEETEISNFSRKVGFAGMPSAFENLLQLAHQWFTLPAREGEWDQARLDQWLSKLVPSAEGETPENYVQRLTLKRRYKNMGVLRSGTRAVYDKVDAEQARRFYRACFMNPADFSFGIIGYLDPEEWDRNSIVRAVCQYIGTIPVPTADSPDYFDPNYNERAQERLAELLCPCYPPWLITEDTFDAAFVGEDPMAKVNIALEIPHLDSQREFLQTRAVAFILEHRLCEIFGEATHGSMNVVHVNTQYVFSMSFPGQVIIDFECPPDMVEELYRLAIVQIRSLSRYGPTRDERDAALRLIHESEAAQEDDRDFTTANLASTRVGELQQNRQEKQSLPAEAIDAELFRVWLGPFTSTIVQMSEDLKTEYARLDEIGAKAEPLLSDEEEFGTSPQWISFETVTTIVGVLGIAGLVASRWLK